jgi:hypothetical protein
LKGLALLIMPIEIRELHIRVSVTTPAAESSPSGASSSGQGSNEASGNNKEEIIAACVEKVMEILQNKTER